MRNSCISKKLYDLLSIQNHRSVLQIQMNTRSRVLGTAAVLRAVPARCMRDQRFVKIRLRDKWQVGKHEDGLRFYAGVPVFFVRRFRVVVLARNFSRLLSKRFATKTNTYHRIYLSTTSSPRFVVFIGSTWLAPVFNDKTIKAAVLRAHCSRLINRSLTAPSPVTLWHHHRRRRHLHRIPSPPSVYCSFYGRRKRR